MGEYFPYILSIFLVLFSSWLAIKLKFSESENEIKNSIKKLFNKILLGLLIFWSLFNLFILKTDPDEITRSEVFKIVFHATILLYILISTTTMRFLDILFNWLSEQSDFNKKHFKITESIAKIQKRTANKPFKQDK
jgi:hypothetical protein